MSETVLDGTDQWTAIQTGDVSESANAKNREFLYNAESAGCSNEWCGAYRYGEWKLIWNDNEDGDQVFWYDFYAETSRWNGDGSLNEEYSDYLECGLIPEWVQTESVYDEDGNALFPCNDSPCLFNLEADPCEYEDVSEDERYHDLYQFMYNMMMSWHRNQQIPLSSYYAEGIDPEGDPSVHSEDGFWAPWIRDYDPLDGYEDFEDVMKQFALKNEIKENIEEDEYYKLARTHLERWKLQVLVGQNDGEHGHGGSQRLTPIALVMVAVIVSAICFMALFLRCMKTICSKQRPTKNADDTEYTPLVHS